MSAAAEPVSSLTFRVTRLPKGTTAFDIVKAVKDIISDDVGLDWVQHIRRGLYKVAVRTQEAAILLKTHGKLHINGNEVPITPFGTPVMIAVLRYPIEFPDREIINTLKAYGSVNKVVRTYYKDFPTVLTGTRKIWMDMITPVPNFKWVMGVRVLFEYNGVNRMCFRCHEIDHSVKDCPIKSSKKCYDCRKVQRRIADFPCPRHMAPAGIELPYPVPSADTAAAADSVRGQASEVDRESNEAAAEGSGTESVAEVKQEVNGKGRSKKHKKKKNKKKGRR